MPKTKADFKKWFEKYTDELAEDIFYKLENLLSDVYNSKVPPEWVFDYVEENNLDEFEEDTDESTRKKLKALLVDAGW